jgi:diguanylate cyclase (GGDEF)-like protein
VERSLPASVNESLSPGLLDRFKSLQSSGAIDALDEMRRENRELDRLVSDASALVALTDVDEMLEFVISRLLDHFIPQFLAFIMEPPRGSRVRQYCYRNLKLSEDHINPRDYRTMKAYFLEHPFLVSFDEMERSVGDIYFSEEFRKLEPHLVFPMRGIGGLYGMAILGTKVIGDDYSDLERMYVDRLIRFLSVGIQNGLHHESSITDPKTGLYNHDYFVRRLDDEIARSQRHGANAGVLMLDIDHFKMFNDQWGHIAGDEMLNAVARTLKETTRTEDTVARFGGEEFCILVLECDFTHLLEVAERIRKAVEETHMKYNGTLLAVTTSIGARMIDTSNQPDANRILEDADKALYVSKASGRNCCTLFRSGFLSRATMIRQLVS